MDFARRALPLQPRIAAPIVAAIFLAALGIAVLRVDLLRVRYGLSDARARETSLLEESRALTVEIRRLRGAARLTERAAELGFVRADRVIALPDPADAR